MQLLTMIETTFRRWAVYSEVRRELGAYGERELADLGIRRSEISTIAREAAARVQPAAKKQAAEKASGAFNKVAQAN